MARSMARAAQLADLPKMYGSYDTLRAHLRRERRADANRLHLRLGPEGSSVALENS